MQPMGRKHKKFPYKIDCHPKNGCVNWWEIENDDGKKKTDRRNGKREIEEDKYDL